MRLPWVIGRFKPRDIVIELSRGYAERCMGTITEIESAIQKLSPSQLSSFRKWFQDFDEEAWDRQLEQDIQNGRLDALAEEALEDLREGRSKEL